MVDLNGELIDGLFTFFFLPSYTTLASDYAFKALSNKSFFSSMTRSLPAFSFLWLSYAPPDWKIDPLITWIR
jgi:hypothetical protein